VGGGEMSRIYAVREDNGGRFLHIRDVLAVQILNGIVLKTTLEYLLELMIKIF